MAYEAWQLTSDMLPSGGRILEIGCGTRPGMLMLHLSAGAHAVGIDFDDPRPGLAGLAGQLRHNGVERAAKTAIRRVMFDGAYYRELERLYGAKIRRDVDVRRADARSLPYGDAEFDLVYSFQVFEHIDGVEAAVAEMRRVLRPTGRAYLDIHLFPSLSGGHDLAWIDANRPPASPPPWDHLRRHARPPHVFLNRLAAHDYLAAFGRHFDVVDLKYVRKGEALATPEIVAETGYSFNDLTREEMRITLAPR